VRALRDEVADMIENPPSKTELQHAKATILNSFVFNYASRRQVLEQQMTFAYYGLPTDYLDRYRAGIEQVRAEDVARAAEKYLHPEKMAWLVVGKTGDFDEPLSTFGEVTTIDITIPPPPDTRPEVEKTASSVAAGDDLLARAADAALGDASGPVRSLRDSSTLVVQMGGQSMSLGRTSSVVLPDKMRVVISTPMGEQTVLVHGDAGAMQAGGRAAPMPAEMVERTLSELNRELLILLDHAGDPGVEAVAAGSDEVEGRACDLVSVTFRGTESRLCIDADGSVLSQSYQGKHMLRGTPGLVEVRFYDYEDVDGWRLPQRSEIRFEGETLATSTVDSLEINPELDPALFELPEAD
jgi:hypothetical protein